MLEGFTGYLLPWDQTAYWATVVGINLNATAPFVGPFLAQFLQGGLATLDRTPSPKFYSLHMLLIPGLIFAADRPAPVPRRAPRGHLAAVVGESRRDASARRPGAPATVRSAHPRGRGRGVGDGSPPPLKERNRAEYKRYKEDVQREGKSFFPYAVLHDSVMSLVVVAVIIAPRLRLVLHARTAPDAGLLGPWYEDEADPGTIAFVPRPDWFFYFLFYLLRIFKWPKTVVLGTVGIPRIS